MVTPVEQVMISSRLSPRSRSRAAAISVSLLVSTLACLLASVGPATSYAALVERTSSHPFYSPAASSYPFRPLTTPAADNDDVREKNVGCGSDKLIVYRVTLNTFWSPDTFPKHYPKWRPPAQWSKVIGNERYIKNQILMTNQLDFIRN
jgi:hypothetical protein